mgnify:CR=1 FL=1
MGMLSKEEMLQLRTSYIEIGKLVQKYGGYRQDTLKYLMSQVECIDSDEDDKVKHQYLVQSYNGLFVYKGSLSDFVIYDSDESKEVLRQLNKKLDKETKKVWKILKKYIL